MMKALLICLGIFCFCGVGRAAPESPFEELLRRAETVFLARVISTSGSTVTIECTELLRGKSVDEMAFAVDYQNGLGRWRHPVSLHTGSEFILLSQGDEKNGPPRSVIGHSFESQFSYRGWTPFPIKRVHHQIHTEGTYSHADGSFTDELALGRVKRLLARFPYGSIRAR